MRMKLKFYYYLLIQNNNTISHFCVYILGLDAWSFGATPLSDSQKAHVEAEGSNNNNCDPDVIKRDSNQKSHQIMIIVPTSSRKIAVQLQSFQEKRALIAFEALRIEGKAVYYDTFSLVNQLVY